MSFVQVPNSFIRTPDLDVYEKAIITYIISHNIGYEFSNERIGQALGINYATTVKKINGLIKRGYLVRTVEKFREEGGKIKSKTFIDATFTPAKNAKQIAFGPGYENNTLAETTGSQNGSFRPGYENNTLAETPGLLSMDYPAGDQGMKTTPWPKRVLVESQDANADLTRFDQSVKNNTAKEYNYYNTFSCHSDLNGHKEIAGAKTQPETQPDSARNIVPPRTPAKSISDAKGEPEDLNGWLDQELK